MVKISNLGYPRLGENREWKKLIESYWAGKVRKKSCRHKPRNCVWRF